METTSGDVADGSGEKAPGAATRPTTPPHVARAAAWRRARAHRPRRRLERAADGPSPGWIRASPRRPPPALPPPAPPWPQVLRGRATRSAARRSASRSGGQGCWACGRPRHPRSRIDFAAAPNPPLSHYLCLPRLRRSSRHGSFPSMPDLHLPRPRQKQTPRNYHLSYTTFNMKA
ncbi:hypothetical protein U9M48_043947 [Paspalum notatum var. saurae]|uniref:Uncharacterized protein n=1 Tax=Paspalum notatum var. saurae TaxID=547442 RepID=A0AAQ3XJ25_PASNO